MCLFCVNYYTYLQIEVKNKMLPILDKVNSKPLVKADPWGKCRWARTNKNIGAKMGEIGKDRTACMDYSNKDVYLIDLLEVALQRPQLKVIIQMYYYQTV